MLDLQRIIGQIKGMSQERHGLYQELRDKLATARNMLSQEAFDFTLLDKKSQISKTSWLIAKPTESLRFYSVPEKAPVYQVMAVDGSQIVPDHHEIALCYLINVGATLLPYGTNYPPIMESSPKLYYREEELYQEFKGQKILIQGEVLAAKRAIEEAEKLAQLLVEAKAREIESVALFDGTMIQWKLESNKKEEADWKNQLLDTFLSSLEECRVQEVPVAGYISGSRSNDVVNLLRLGLCSESAPNCDHCKFSQDRPCSKIEGTTDASLFNAMAIGDRTSVFFSSSKVLEEYGDHYIGFFYVNVGSEIARVEAPRWVLENKQYLNFIHATIFDQAQKGLGYPVALSEAHELAIIKGTDRQLFFNLLAEFYVQKGIPVEVSSKSLSKRRPVV